MCVCVCVSVFVVVCMSLQGRQNNLAADTQLFICGLKRKWLREDDEERERDGYCETQTKTMSWMNVCCCMCEVVVFVEMRKGSHLIIWKWIGWLVVPFDATVTCWIHTCCMCVIKYNLRHLIDRETQQWRQTHKQQERDIECVSVYVSTRQPQHCFPLCLTQIWQALSPYTLYITTQSIHYWV